MNEQPVPPKYVIELDLRIAAFSVMSHEQIDRSLAGVMSYLDALVHVGVVDQSFREETRRRAADAAILRKTYLEDLKSGMFGIGCHMVGVVGAGAAAIATMLDRHSTASDFMGILMFAALLVLGHGLMLLSPGYRPVFAEVLRAKFLWLAGAAWAAFLSYGATSVFFEMRSATL